MSAQLTPHHHRLMQMRLNGSTNAQIGQELRVSEKAIQYHMCRINKELGSGTVAEQIRKYYEYRQAKGLKPLI